MSVENMPIKSKVLFSKLLATMIKKETMSYGELSKRQEIENKKELLRKLYSELQERYQQGLVLESEYNEQSRLYSYNNAVIELEQNKNENDIDKKNLYRERLEILYKILSNNFEETLIPTDEIYNELLEAVKDEQIADLERKLKQVRLVLQIDLYDKKLEKEDLSKYRDELYDTQEEIKKIKSVLKIDKLNNIKDIPFENLVTWSSEDLINTLYEDELLNKKTK